MKVKRISLELALLFSGTLTGWLALSLGPQGWVHQIFPTSILQKRADVFQQVILVYGLFLIALGSWGMIQYWRNANSLAQSSSGTLQAFWLYLKQTLAKFIEFNQSIPKSAWIWLTFQLAIGVLLSAYFLSQPMRGDEAYSFLYYINPGGVSLFKYTAPNNHVFYTILAKVSTLFFGNEPAIIRLPAFLASIVNILLVFYWLQFQRKHDAIAGILAPLLMGIFPYLVLYATNARGYTIQVSLALLLALFGLRFIRQRQSGDIFFLALFSALSVLTMPSAIVTVAGIVFWIVTNLCLQRVSLYWLLHSFALPYGFFSLTLAGIFYTPVILASDGIEPIFSNKFVRRLTYDEFVTGILPHIEKTWLEMTRDIHPAFLLAGILLIIVGLVQTFRARNFEISLLLPLLLIGAIIIFIITVRLPYTRTWIYILPFILITLEYGAQWILNRLNISNLILTRSILLIFGAWFAALLISNNVIGSYLDTSAFPEAKIVAQYLKPILQEGDYVHVTNTANVPLEFYFWYYGLPERDFTKRSETGRRFYVVKKSHYSIEDMTDKPVILHLDIDNMALYERIKE
jgi:hypothetical protein